MVKKWPKSHKCADNSELSNAYEASFSLYCEGLEAAVYKENVETSDDS